VAHLAESGTGAPDAAAPYTAWHRWSGDQREEFWGAWLAYAAVQWEGAARPVATGGHAMAPVQRGGPRWFPGVRLNFAENLLAGADADRVMIARDERGRRRELARGELRASAAAFARMLLDLGVQPGDRVAGYLPNIPETVVAMLGTAWVGAVWTSCSPDFGVQGVLDRFGQVGPRVLVCADGYQYAGKSIDILPRVKAVVAGLPSVERVVVVPFLRDVIGDAELAGIRGAVPWGSVVAGAGQAEPAFERLVFDHPLYVMYSSGTTGLPKCMVHGAGGTLLQHLKEHRLHCDITPGERVFYFTTCGWMMWNWLVTALASGGTIVLYDGAPLPPAEPGLLWRMAAEERVNVFGTSAKFLAASEKAGLAPGASGSLRLILSTGSPLADYSFDYVWREVKPGVRIASISGGTDLISCFMLGHPTLPVRRGELQCAGLAMAVEVWDDQGRPLGPGDGPGELVCTAPFPSMPVAFWNDPDGSKYHDAYFSRFPGTWRHGDWVEITASGGYVVHGRSDATLNPGGVRIGTAEIYREVEQVDGVVESVVVGQEMPDSRGATDVRIVLFVRLADGRVLDDALREAIRARLRANASPHHVPRVIAQVRDIPRTISGKITEIAIREVIHGRPVKNTEAMANPEALEEFRGREELRVANDYDK